MNWKFAVQYGKIYDSDGFMQAIGYAGHGQGKNNPGFENIKGVGPLPHGLWKPVEFFEDHPHVGKFAVRLEPADDETLKRVLSYGRDPKSFFFHGDSVEHPGEASDGCIIGPPELRKRFWAEKLWMDVTAA